MGYAAEILGIFHSQWDYQTVKISRVLKFLTWHGFDEFGRNEPYTFKIITNHNNCPFYIKDNMFLNVFDSDIILGNLTATISGYLSQFAIKPNMFDNILGNRSNNYEMLFKKIYF